MVPRNGLTSFNPRARTGRDCHLPLVGWQVNGFQSTRPHGARPRSRSCWCRCACFNPRARTGRDVRCHPSAFAFECFNPRARTGRDSVILPTRISTPIVGPIAIPSHDLLISPITPIQVRKFLMITRCWRRANRQRKTRSLQVRGSKNQGTL